MRYRFSSLHIMHLRRRFDRHRHSTAPPKLPALTVSQSDFYFKKGVPFEFPLLNPQILAFQLR
jgi:hypothetical protein